MTANSLKKAKNILMEDWKYYYRGRIFEAEYFNCKETLNALKEFETKGECKEIIKENYVLNRDFLKKVKQKTGEEHFWKYIAWRIKETEENEDFRNYMLILTNCKPEVKTLYKNIGLETFGDNLFKEYKKPLKRLNLHNETLWKISRKFETFDFNG